MVDIMEAKRAANKVLADPKSSYTKRTTVIKEIEESLRQNKIHRGFVFLTNNDLPVDVKPGIRCGLDGNPLNEPQCFENTDDTRREYK